MSECTIIHLKIYKIKINQNFRSYNHKSNMPISKNNVLDKTNATYVPDLTESVKKRNTTRSNSQNSE